jgi:hypothetical protein
MSRVNLLMPGWTARLSGLALLVALTSGCATFKASSRLDVGPFAENTVGMIGEVQRATKPAVWMHLKRFDSVESVRDVRVGVVPFRKLMRNVALYSTQVVSIYESDLSDQRKAEELAIYLDETVRQSLETSPAAQVFMSQGGLDSAVAAVRTAPTFMAALGHAQPVVSAALAYGNRLCDSLSQRIDYAAADVDARVEAEFAPVREQMVSLMNLQLKATREYTLVNRYRLGEDAALDTLRALDPEVAEALPVGKKPVMASLDAAEKRILAKIETASSLRSDLNERFNVYQLEQQELDALRNSAQESARLGRITLMLWARSHRNLAAGVKVPAALDVMGLVKNAAGSATKTIL